MSQAKPFKARHLEAEKSVNNTHFVARQGVMLKRVVLAQSSLWPAERKSLEAINDGVFAAW
jgi:hypothetical protein